MTTSTIDELSVDVRRWIVLETALFELLGEQARSEKHPPAVRRVLSTWCHRHAWHAELWQERLPLVPHHEFPDLGNAQFVAESVHLVRDDVGALIDPVLMGMRDRLAAHRERTDPLLDGPTTRIIELVDADFVRELSDLTGVLSG